MASSTSYDVIVDTLRIGVPAALIVVGWIIVSKQQDRRERRKEIRSIVDELRIVILKIREETIEYFSDKNTEPNGILSDSIKLNFLLISQYLFILKSAGFHLKVNPELIALRKTATGGFFETVDFVKQKDDPRWMGRLRSESVELLLAIEKSYFSRFKIKM